MTAPVASDDPRWARHRLLPEIGRLGQARLLERRVGPLEGDPVAAEVARLYLERAGVSVAEDAPPLSLADAAAVDALAGVDELRVAAAFVAGTFAAVEVIKETVGAGQPARWPGGLRLDGRDAPSDEP